MGALSGSNRRNRGFSLMTREAGPGSAPRCSRCRLYRDCQSEKMAPGGKGKAGIVVVAEAPGETEDRLGEQLVGKAGSYLADALASFDIDLHQDCFKTNAINCRPPGNRTPTPNEIEACRPIIWNLCRDKHPRLVLLFGSTALQSWLGHRWKKNQPALSEWRGFVVPDREFNCWWSCTWHPSYLMRMSKDRALHTVWAKDIERALGQLLEPPPVFADEEGSCTTLTPAEATDLLRGVKNELIAFDYETTGLKPYDDDTHHAVCVGIAREDHAFAFELKDKRVRRELSRVLRDPGVGKIASNMKFEELWTRWEFDHGVESWEWDTMQAAHVIDNRPGITSIKFDAARRLGIYDYASEITPFLASKGQYTHNTVLDAPRDKLLLYCAMDALIEHKVALLQMDELGV